MAPSGCHVVLAVLLLGTNQVAAFLGAPLASFRRRPGYMPHSSSNAVGHEKSPAGSPEQEVLPSHFQSAASIAWVQQILDSYEETFDGQSLIPSLDRTRLSPEEQAREVALADVAVVSHDFLRNAEDPIYIYGNVEGLRTFGYTWEEFTALPSRKTCGEDVQAERKELLENVRELDDTTPVADFSAVRVTKTGKELRISVAVWNVKSAGKKTVGQAARYTVCD